MKPIFLISNSLANTQGHVAVASAGKLREEPLKIIGLRGTCGFRPHLNNRNAKYATFQGRTQIARGKNVFSRSKLTPVPVTAVRSGSIVSLPLLNDLQSW